MTTDDEPSVFCRHLIICRSIWYDSTNPDQGYSLGRLVVSLEPLGEDNGPFIESRLFAFVQLFGVPSDYDVWMRLVRIELDEAGEEATVFVTDWGPWVWEITGLELVDSRGFELPRVPFGEPGLYEFQFWAEGLDQPIGWERVEVRAIVRE